MFVAEIGSNFLSYEHAKHSIVAAKAAGADAVKFQLFSHRELYGYDGPAKDGQLPRDWVAGLAAKAEVTGIEFMCTAFSVSGVKFLDPFVKRHKIASSDLTHLELLRAVKATGKPIVLSTGASSEGDIRQALAVLDGSDVTLLYCISEYPTRSTDVRTITMMRDSYGVPVGLSDHSTEIISVPLAAVQAGAVMIEKHMTAYPEIESPDRPHSLTDTEFAKMVRAVRGLEVASGPTTGERDMFLRHNRRLVAMGDLPAGTTLQHEINFGAYRAQEDDTKGLSPFAWEHLEGKRLKVGVKRGEGIGPSDFD